MRIKSILIIATFILGKTPEVSGQDATFTQWEHISTYINPALTGNLEMHLRFRGKYRNQWNSVLGSNAYKTSAASIEYKFDSESNRKYSIGFYSLIDRAGSVDLTTSAYSITTSIIQRVGNLNEIHHDIGIGIETGFGNRSLGAEKLRWPHAAPKDFLPRATYFNLSTGLIWKYYSESHFSFHFGAALHNLNRPNVSFFNRRVELSRR